MNYQNPLFQLRDWGLKNSCLLIKKMLSSRQLCFLVKTYNVSYNM
jgi:hypothetical protein